MENTKKNDFSGMITIPYVVYETQQERTDRQHKRFWILCLVLIAALIITNACWIVYEAKRCKEKSDTSCVIVNQASDQQGTCKSVVGTSPIGDESD